MQCAECGGSLKEGSGRGRGWRWGCEEVIIINASWGGSGLCVVEGGSVGARLGSVQGVEGVVMNVVLEVCFIMFSGIVEHSIYFFS